MMLVPPLALGSLSLFLFAIISWFYSRTLVLFYTIGTDSAHLKAGFTHNSLCSKQGKLAKIIPSKRMNAGATK